MDVAICLLSLCVAFIVKVWLKWVLSHNMNVVYEVETHNKQKEICSKRLGETRHRFRTAVVWELLVFKTSSHRVHPSSLTCIFCKHEYSLLCHGTGVPRTPEHSWLLMNYNDRQHIYLTHISNYVSSAVTKEFKALTILAYEIQENVVSHLYPSASLSGQGCFFLHLHISRTFLGRIFNHD